MIRALNLVAKNATNLTMASSPSMRRQMSTQLNFETLEVTNPHEFVFHVKLNRPQKYVSSLSFCGWFCNLKKKSFYT